MPQVSAMDALPDAAPASALAGYDRENGAPWDIRLAAAQAVSPADKLAVVRQYAPDAHWVEFGGKSGGERLSRQTGATYQEQPQAPERHIVYTDPVTGKPSTMNPRGFDLGDVVEWVPQVVRGIAYGAGAGATQLVPGAEGNPLAMAGGGTAASQATKYATDPLVEMITGRMIPDTRPTGEKVREGLVDVGSELLLSGTGELSGMALSKLRRIPYRQEMKRIMREVPPGEGRPGVLAGVEGMARDQGEATGPAISGALPLATRGETVRSFFKSASLYPRASEIIRNAIDRTDRVLRREFERVRGAIGQGAKERGTAGQSIKWGLADYAKSTQRRQSELEDALEAVVGGKTPVEMRNTAEMIRAELAKVPPGAKPGGGVVPQDYLDLLKTIDAGGDKLPFEYVRAFRESIGEATSGGLIAPTGQKTKWYDPLYSAITRDLENAADQAGPKARKLWGQAQSNWAQRETRLELLRQVANAERSEDAFRAAISGANDGPSRLIALKASVPKNAWDDLVAVKLWEMGTTSAGRDAGDAVEKAFSPIKFIKNWVDMSDASKAQLFPKGTRLRAELDRLATVTAALRESRNALSGRLGESGTPGGTLFMDMLGDGALTDIVAGGPVGWMRQAKRVLTPLGKARRAERQALLMTDPDFVRWLADGTKIPPTPTGVGSHLRRLTAGAFASKPPAVRQAIRDYLEDWRSALDESQQDNNPQPVKR